MMGCWAYLPDGSICKRPAQTVDPVRGMTVCDRHARWWCGNCETWNSVEDEVCEDCGLPRTLEEDAPEARPVIRPWREEV